jgi:hypothetical protein
MIITSIKYGLVMKLIIQLQTKRRQDNLLSLINT